MSAPKSEHTTYLQESFQLPPQGAEESDLSFRRRIAGELRDLGHIIEAHEAMQNERYDSDNARGADVMAGIAGAMVQALRKVDYHVTGANQADCDLVAGLYIKHKEPDPSPESILMMMDLQERMRR